MKSRLPKTSSRRTARSVIAAGEVVDTVITGEDGVAESKLLYLGKYEVRETEAPYGMVINAEVYSAELVYAGQEIEITDTAVKFHATTVRKLRIKSCKGP